MSDDYEFNWAVPKDLSPEILVDRASKAIQAINRLVDNNYGNPAPEDEIKEVLTLCGFGMGAWKIKFDAYKNGYTLNNPVWSLLKDNLKELKV